MDTHPFMYILAGLGTFNGIVFGIYLVAGGINNKKAYMYLGFFLILISIRIFRSVHFYYAGLNLPVYYAGHSAFFLALPFIYFYYRAFFRNREKLSYKDILFFLPGIILAIPHFRIVNLTGFTVFMFYILLSHRELIRFRQRTNPSSRVLQAYHYHLHRNIILFLYVIIFFTALNLIYRFIPYITGALSYSFLLYLMVFFWNRNLKYRRNARMLEKYDSNIIPDSTIEAHIKKLLDRIEKEKLYTDSTLTMVKLADLLSIPSYQLSKILNRYLHKNFPDFINEYRVREAERLLTDPANHREAVENIGYESGFNNPSSFFTAFKKFTNSTPAKYRKEQS